MFFLYKHNVYKHWKAQKMSNNYAYINHILNVHSQNKRRIVWNPPDRGVDPDTETALGRRGRCEDIRFPIVAMVPSEDEVGAQPRMQSDIGLTFETHPVFWFYIPDLPSEINEISFRIQDEERRSHVNRQIFIPINTTPSIVGFRLPQDQKSLELDTKYKWIVSIPCEEDEPPMYAEAWIQRIEHFDGINSSFNHGIVDDYAAKGILHETLTSLFFLYQEAPRNESHQMWVSFLTDLKLSSIAIDLVEPILIED